MPQTRDINRRQFIARTVGAAAGTAGLAHLAVSAASAESAEDTSEIPHHQTLIGGKPSDADPIRVGLIRCLAGRLVRGRHNRGDPVGDGLFGHRQRRLPTFRAVVESGKQMAVDVNEGGGIRHVGSFER